MATGDRSFPAQDALTALLKALPALAAWHVDYGIPLDRSELECWVDEQVITARTEVTSGLVSYDETFTLHVWLYAKKTGATALEIRSEMDAAKVAIESALTADPTLSGVVMQAVISGTEFDSGIADAEARSRDAALTIDVACLAFVG
jgi:hypothetical protein